MNPNTITICLGSDASPEDIARAVLALESFTGNLGAVSMAELNSGTVITGQQASTEQGNLELDSEGLPHDERIHASTKGKTQAGTWTKKKGVDDKTREAVVAELRQKYPDPQATSGAVAGSAAIAAGIGLPAGGITIPAVAVNKTEYQKLCEFIAANVGKGQFTQAFVDSTFAHNNLTLAGIAGNEEYSKQFREAFEGFVAQQ